MSTIEKQLARHLQGPAALIMKIGRANFSFMGTLSIAPNDKVESDLGEYAIVQTSVSDEEFTNSTLVAFNILDIEQTHLAGDDSTLIINLKD